MRISDWSSDVCSSDLAAARPALEVLKLVDAAIFNVIIGNADAHAKNFSLLRQKDGGGPTVLAPLYDLVGTVVWPELSPRFAMTFGGAGTLEQLEAKDRKSTLLHSSH